MQLACFKEEKIGNRTQIIYNGTGFLKIYIPKSYYSTKYAIELGANLQTIGLFVYEYLNKKYLMLLPIKIDIEFSEKEKFKGKLKPEVPADEYDVFILKPGNAFIHDINHVQDIEDAELGINKLLIEGKLPTFLSYEQAYKYITNLLAITNINSSLNVSSMIFEFILAELYRDKNNIHDPFRKAINGNPRANLYNYRMVKMTSIPALHSTFNAISGQDSYQQILNAVLRQRSGTKEIESPVEKVLKF